MPQPKTAELARSAFYEMTYMCFASGLLDADMAIMASC